MNPDADFPSLLRLHLTPGVGAVTYKRLLRKFGSPAGILAAPRDRLLEVEGVGPVTADAIRDPSHAEEAKREVELAERHGLRILVAGTDAYPTALRFIEDAPLILYAKGTVEPRDALALAIVGSRHATHYGMSQSRRLADGLARMGFTVVSGLARGIDAAAHEGALAAGGRTIAVLGNGLAQVYPPENDKLAERIVSSGALLSEFPVESPPQREHFPRRNRVISGLTLGTIVVEGNRQSGALITARFALEQGKEVFAVPGPVDRTLSQGPHMLIRQGAKLVETVEDVLEELGPVADELKAEVAGASARDRGESGPAAPAAAGTDIRALTLSPRERKVYDAIGSDPIPIDEVIHVTGLAPAEVSSTLMVLEIRRAIRQLPGKRFVRA